MSETILEAARRYHARGYALTSIPTGRKGPIDEGWPRKRYAHDELISTFHKGGVGVIVGAASGGLVDVDCDCEEAVDAAAVFLPKTGAIHGRPSNPRSHYWYVSPSATTLIQYRDPTDKEMLVEVRTAGDESDKQTVLPPSLHPEGERYRWDEDGEPAHVDDRALIKAVGTVAAAALLARHFPDSARHEFCLALGGMLLRTDWEVDDVRDFVYAVAYAGGSEDPDTRADTVRYSAEKLANEEPVTGYTRLESLLGPKGGLILDAVFTWMGLGNVPRADFALTELGLAERVAHANRVRLVYVPESESWHVWTGQRWERDVDGAVRRAVIDTIKAIQRDAEKALETCPVKLLDALALPKSQKREDMIRCFPFDDVDRATQAQANKHFALKMQEKKHIVAVVDLLTSIEGMSRRLALLDADPWLFNCANGTLDLRTGLIRPHDPADLITKLSPIAYDPAARAPTFDRFLEQVQPDPAMRDYLQRAHGYSLTGSTKAQCFFMCIGTGSNGKGVLDRLRRRVWGEYATSAEPSTFLAKSTDGVRNDLADLAGARLVTVAEIDAGRKLAESLIKQVTGQDPLKARFLWSEHFEQMPTYKVWMSSNHRPRVNGTDYGIWRRLKLIPFDVVILEADQDPDLTDKLEAELSGIFAWVVRGCLEWQRTGLCEPGRVKEAVETYRVALDPLGEWIEGNCIMDSTARESTADLYRDYSLHCARAGLQAIAKDDFTDHLPHKGLEAVKFKQTSETIDVAAGKIVKRVQSVRGWRGIRLRKGTMTDVSTAPTDAANG